MDEKLCIFRKNILDTISDFALSAPRNIFIVDDKDPSYPSPKTLTQEKAMCMKAIEKVRTVMRRLEFLQEHQHHEFSQLNNYFWMYYELNQMQKSSLAY